MKLNSLALLIVTTLILSACTTIPEAIPYNGTEADQAMWVQHKKAISKITHWTAEGKAAVKVDGDNTNMNIYWRQEKDESSMRLSGPLGQGAVTVNAGPNYGQFIQGDTNYQTSSLEQLILDLSEIPIPAQGFRYWLLGIPSPNALAELYVDDRGLMVELHQYDWTITFSNYSLDESHPLPGRITAQRNGDMAKVVIKQWSLDELL